MPTQYSICSRWWSTSRRDFRLSSLDVERERVSLPGLTGHRAAVCHVNRKNDSRRAADRLVREFGRRVPTIALVWGRQPVALRQPRRIIAQHTSSNRQEPDELIGSYNAFSELSGSESRGPDPGITYATELSAAIAPTFTDHPVEGFGEEARDDVSDPSCDDNSGDKEQRNRPDLISVLRKDREQCENDEHVSQIHFVTALAETEQRREQARTFPLRLRGGNDNHASSQRDHRHI